MRPLILVSVILFPFLYAQDWCCPRKNVGGKFYNLVSSNVDGSMWGCSDNCAYTMEGDTTKRFCFRPGAFESKCDSTGMPGNMTTGMPGGGGMTNGGGMTTGMSGGGGCRCGEERSNRIVGGTEVSINKYPWLVRIGNKEGASYCGGTLVASKYVISAAHCFQTTDDFGVITGVTDPSEVLVWIGDHNIFTSGETSLTEKQVDVVSLIHHPNYEMTIGQEATGPYDLTVMELAEAVDLNMYTPACMAKSTDATTFDGKMATVAGWGVLSEGGPFPDPFVPHEVELPVVAASVCPGVDGSPSDICAGGEGGKDSCQSDSGGPLTYKQDNGQHVLIGDVSRGLGCARPGEYGLYGRISHMRDWINSKMSSAEFCPNGGADAA